MMHPIGDGSLTFANVRQILDEVWDEYPALHAVFPTQPEAEAAAEQILLRFIWHLHQAGYPAGRQKNPSGLISKDKFTIKCSDFMLETDWHWVDCMALGSGGVATRIVWSTPNVNAAQHVPDAGIPDGAVPPQPQPQPQPPSGQPYDESFWLDAGAQFKAEYDQANDPATGKPPHPLDSGFYVWPGRTAYDWYVGGMTGPASLKKHLAECRAALGLSPLS